MEDKPFINIPLGMYLSLIVGNLVFAGLHPDWWFVGVLGAVFFSVCWYRSTHKKLPVTTVADNPGKE
jgi:hypothetical protein